MKDKDALTTSLVTKNPTTPVSGTMLSRSQKDMVREELERLLASTRFNSSQRCQLLLRFVVESVLSDNADSLKERSIGIAVFGRVLSYDTNNDPVVRVAAGEVRKKLAQCYCDSTWQLKVRIELPIGSYVPLFSWPEKPSHEVESSACAIMERAEAEGQIGFATQDTFETHSSHQMVWWLVSVLLVAVVCSFFYWQFHSKPRDAFETFWAPMVKSASPVLICVGNMQLPPLHPPPGTTPSPFATLANVGNNDNQNNWPITPLQDSITLVNLTLLLRNHNKAFAIRGQKATSFEDLQKGPIILLGAFNNDWTIRLMQPLRFHFAIDQTSYNRWIVDQQKPGMEIGAVQNSIPRSSTEDFVLIARTFDPHTQEPTIVIAGVTPTATHAAGEFLTNPVYLNDFGKKAPQNWQTKNMEVLLVTNNVNGDSGPPRVVDSYFW
jgi:hypothetical protein